MVVSYITKRTIDIIISLLAIIFCSPVIILISFLIKSNTRGQVIFKQKRMGQHGKQFYIYKFKTLDIFDSKSSRLGEFLRKTFLDELPQIINVLKGDMSLVGPRPELFEIAKEYNDKQKERLTIKPGLTGLWQISPYIDEPIHNHLEYDFSYIDNQSLWLDLRILSETAILFLKKILQEIIKFLK